MSTALGHPEAHDEGPGELTAELVGAAIDGGRVVRPGDVLVLSAADPISPEMADLLATALASELDERVRVVVLSRLRFECVYREDET